MFYDAINMIFVDKLKIEVHACTMLVYDTDREGRDGSIILLLSLLFSLSRDCGGA